MLDRAVSDAIQAGAELADVAYEWPASLVTLGSAGAMGWSIPTSFGGAGLSPRALFSANAALGSACLTTGFILSQRDAAIRRLLAGADHLRQRFLPELAAGRCFATVGLSQLTTSRQHQQPSFRAAPYKSGGYQLTGEIPWVTGADRADIIIVGATFPDGQQALFVLPTGHRGVSVGPPLPLLALRGSRTCLVTCQDVVLGADYLLAGPTERVLGGAGGGGLETSCLALALARSAAGYLEGEAKARPNLAPIADRFLAHVASAERQLFGLAETPSPNPDATLALRVRSTQLALRSAQAALAVAKGAGFVTPSPVARWARQALFFLVWSCPKPVAEGVLEALVPSEPPPD